MDDGALFRRVHPREYYERFLHRPTATTPSSVAAAVRPDGRKPDQCRKVSIQAGSLRRESARGSSLVRLGATMMMCGVTVRVAESLMSAAPGGQIVANVEMSAMCSGAVQPGPPTPHAQSVAVQLQRLLDGCIAAADLAVPESRYGLVVHVDVYCVNWDGSAFDAAALAAVTALLDTRLPILRVNADGKLVQSRRKTVPFPLRHVPVPLTMSIFSESVALSDPTAEEEQVQQSLMTVTVCASSCQHKPGSVLSLHKSGGTALSRQQIVDAAQRCRQDRVQAVQAAWLKAGIAPTAAVAAEVAGKQ